MKVLLLIMLVFIALFFFFFVKKAAPSADVSNIGPGYIPAFQGHPEIGVRT